MKSLVKIHGIDAVRIDMPLGVELGIFAFCEAMTACYFTNKTDNKTTLKQNKTK